MNAWRFLILVSVLSLGAFVSAAGPEDAQAPVQTAEPIKEKADSPEAAKKPAEAEAEKKLPPVGISQGSWDTCLPDAGVVEDLKKRNHALEEKEKELKVKESDLKA